MRNALYRADLASQHHTLPEVFAQDPRSRGPRALPPTEVLDNSSLRGVLQQIALEHVCNQVQELRKADGADPVFAVRYETSSFALCPKEPAVPSQPSLVSMLPALAVHECEGASPTTCPVGGGVSGAWEVTPPRSTTGTEGVIGVNISSRSRIVLDL